MFGQYQLGLVSCTGLEALDCQGRFLQELVSSPEVLAQVAEKMPFVWPQIRVALWQEARVAAAWSPPLYKESLFAEL